MKREVRLPAFAKVNLRLHILGKRPDGYHELRTIFQTVSLHDTLEFRASKRPGITLLIHGNEALAREDLEKNLVYLAVDALRREILRNHDHENGLVLAHIDGRSGRRSGRARH